MNLFDDDVIYDDGDDQEDDLLLGDDIASSRNSGHSSRSALNFEDDFGSGLGDEVLPAGSAPLPRHNPFCLGHEKQESLLLDLFNKGSLPHAFIFSGPRGIGKATTAFRFARFLLKHGKPQEDGGGLFGDDEALVHTSIDVSSDDVVFSRVASGGHPDFRYIERGFSEEKGKQERDLKIEALRKIEPFLRMKSADGGWRVVIIEDADTMNRNAQNAILKILEEPPDKVLMVLIAHRLGALIPTIRSRARVIPFHPLPEAEVTGLLRRYGCTIAQTELPLLHQMSQGSVGQALRIAEEGGLDNMRVILNILDDPDFPDWVRIHDLANELSQTTQDKDYRAFSDGFVWLLRCLLTAKARGFREPPAFIQSPKIKTLIREKSLDDLITIFDNMKNIFYRTEFSNLDRRDAVRSSFLVISQ